MSELVLRLFVRVVAAGPSLRDDRGQTTAEYALVIVGAAAVAALVLAWATKTHAISRLFDVVIDKVVPG